MSKRQMIQPSFVAGELDPQLYGRLDLETYSRGAGTLTNVMVMPHGGVKRRPGMVHVDDVPADHRLVPFAFNDKETYLFVFSPEAMRIYQNHTLVASYTSADKPALANLTTDVLATMNWTQSNDVLLLVHADMAPVEIFRQSTSTWEVRPLTLTSMPVYAYGGITTDSGYGSLGSNGLTGEVVLDSASSSSFSPSDVGQMVKLRGGRILITEYISGSTVRGSVRTALTTTSSTTSWQFERGYEPVMSESRGYPSAITFYQGRLVLGGFKSRPQTMLMSRSGDFFNFDVGHGLDDHAIDVTIDDDRVNAIRHLFPGRDLQVFTSGGEFYASADTSSVLTPKTVVLRRASFHGCSYLRPESVDGATLFVEANGRVMRQFLYSDVEQSYAAGDITLLSAHLLTGMKRLTLRRSTDIDAANYIYVVNRDGKLAVLNLLRSQSLQAWSGWHTQGSVQDITTVGDVVYLTCQRGEDTFLERLDDHAYLDSSVIEENDTPQSTWQLPPKLADFYADEAVFTFADSYPQGEQLPAGGEVTTPLASRMQAGLPFYATVATLPIDRAGSAGRYKRLVSVAMRLHESGPITIKQQTPTYTRIYTPAQRQFGLGVLDASPALRSDWVKVHLGGVSRAPVLTITQQDPTPLYILNLTVEVSL